MLGAAGDVTELIEIIRAAHAAYLEQEAHPFDDSSAEAVVCEVVHMLLERDASRLPGDLQVEIRQWLGADAGQMTDDELRLRLAYDQRDYVRASNLRVGEERNPRRVTSLMREARLRGIEVP